MSTIYHFYRAPAQHPAVRVTVSEGGIVGQVLPPRFDLRQHSPEGYEWGYSESGPAAQLALALCAHALRDDQLALQVYQGLKDRLLAGEERNVWSVPRSRVLQLVEEIETSRKGTDPTP